MTESKVTNLHLSRNETKILAERLKLFLNEAIEMQIPKYSSKYARKDYNLHQLYAVLCLQYSLTIYERYPSARSIETLLQSNISLQKTLKLKKVPDHCTLTRAFKILDELRFHMAIIDSANSTTYYHELDRLCERICRNY